MARLRMAASIAAFGAVLAIFLAVVVVPAGAQDGDEQLAVIQLEQLRTAAGAELVPIRVTVESRRAVESLLEIRSSNTNLTWQFPLALAANTEVVQTIAVPATFGDLGRIEATLTSGGDELASSVNNGRDGNENAVGVLGVDASAEEVAMRPDSGQASLIELDDLRLLPALDTLVVSPAAVRALSVDEQRELLGWVWSGHQLLVPAEPGSISDFLRTESSEMDSVVLAGTGVVRYVGQDWEAQVSPGISVAVDPNQQNNFGFVSLENAELLNDGGFSVPGIGLLAIVLLVYLVIAGPIVFAVLRSRNMSNKAWVVLPALAALFTVGIFFGGQILNSGRSDAYAAIVEVNPVGGTRTETILIASSGKQTVELPEGYSLTGTAVNDQFNFRAGGVPITLQPSRTTTDVVFEIDQGSGGTAVVTGTDAAFADQLSIENLDLNGNELTGTVTNNSGQTLFESVVFVGERPESIGEIPNGEQVEFTIDLSGMPARFASELRDWDVDGRQNFDDFGGRNEQTDAVIDGPVNGTSWLVWRSGKLGSAVADGLVTVVGWSRDLDSIQGGRGRTALVARSTLPDSDAALLPAQIRSFQMQAPFFNQFGGFEGGDESVQVAQFVRPVDGDSSDLALPLDREASELELWVDDEWRSMAITDDTGTSIAIPEDVWIDNTLTARYSFGNFFDGGASDPLLLVTVGDATEQIALLPAGESAERRNDFDDDFVDGPGFGGDEVLGQVTVVEHTLGIDENFEFIAEGELDGTYDEWQIDLLEGDRVEVEMNQLNQQAPLDPYLSVLDGEGREVASNDDNGFGLSSALSFEVGDSGVHTIETRPLGGGPAFGPYEVVILVSRPESEDGQ